MNGLIGTDARKTLKNLLELLDGTQQVLHHPDGPLLQLANHHSSSISSMDLSVMVPGNLRKIDDEENITNGDQRCKK